MKRELKLYNTRTRSLDVFQPLHGKKVGLYTCGPTVYDTAHLGNLRSYIFSDILKRTLTMNGFQVKHVMNVTDVGHLTSDADTGEDKLQRAAKAEHQTAWDIAKKYETQFWHDIKELNILPPDIIVKATDRIPDQIALIQILEKKGFTYTTSDGVYFDTAKFPSYGALSRQKREDKVAGARVEVNQEKRHPADFAVWKFSPTDTKRDMEWQSPWGKGFPGWHIECSAISMKELGDQFDIHTGGIDHIPVHHENEIAQSEAATGKSPFVNFWLHGEFLVIPGKRMGKSEGNVITLADVIAKGVHPLAFRYLCLQTHYRQKMNFNWESLQAAQIGLEKIWHQIDEHQVHPKIGCAEFEQRFAAAVNHDLDTPRAVAIMHQLLKSEYPWSAKLQSLSVFDRVLALGLSSVDPGRLHTAVREVPAGVAQLLEQREQARQKKQWTLADTFRREIEASGYVIKDTDTGPVLHKK
ncbi:MAG: cysteine--tRNA ligase [Candidatus Kerfeldbacteria bacterium]|nr:cysteine--tRNA ligase [Candidatus Kerfeldbacteria bacterium]